MYRVLCLDGGGFRGFLQSNLLRKIELENSKLTNFNAIAGTSVGSINAAAIAIGMPLNDVIGLIDDIGPRVFKNPWWEKIEEIWGLRKAKYSNSELKKTLKEVFGDRTIADVRKKILITAFNMKHTAPNGDIYYRPIVMHNIGKGSYADTLLWEACLASAAAPTYFSTYSPRNFDSGLIDGGVWGNNPAMSLVSQLMRPPRGKKVTDLSVLSVGTGFNAKFANAKNKNWGIYDWIKKGHLLDIMTGDATVGATHYYCETLLGVRR